jgi:hypothetical protein
VASPFAVFRRNQRILVAIAGITAMVAFVFLDPVMKYVGRTTKAENPVVVETRYGGLTGSQLEGMRYSRDVVDRFLQLVTRQTVLVQLEKGMMDPRLRDQAEQQYYSFWKQNLMGRSKLGPEASAIETMVMAKKADQLGMVVSDAAINDLIKQITDNSLDSGTLQAVINQLQGGRQKVSAVRLFDALRTEMLASKLSQLFFQSLRDIPPAQRFEYYERLNRRAKAEILPLAVASFVDQVSAEPTNDELRAFYDKYKNSFPNPASPEPGFKEPKRASFQYFKADFAKLKDEFKPQVTEAEIREYYEKNKAQFRVVELPGADADKDKAGADEKPEEKAGDEKATEEKAAETPQAEEPKAESPSPEAPQAEEPQAEPGTPQASRGASVFQLVNQETPADDKPAGEKPAAEAPASAEPPAAAETPAATTEAPADASAEKPAEEIKYEPLEKVQDTIRDTIAGEKANARMVEVFDELQAAMRRYADDRDLFAARPDAKANAAQAPVFAFEELAKSKNVEAKALDMVTSAEAASTDIGGVQRTVRRSQFDFRNEPFNEFAFAESLVKYKPEAGQDGEGNGYLFWKTDDKPAFVPPLDTIREKVVYAWKLIKARDLAQKRADELAGQARAAKKPLAEVFTGQPDLKVTETAPFSWLTTGNVPQDPFGSQPRLSEVDGVEHPGEAFMKAVFGLSPGEIGVASNNPQDTYYVVRLVDYDRPTEELRNEFATEPPNRYMAVANAERNEIYLSWLADLEREAKVHWVRPADSISRRGEAEDIPSETAGL